MAAAASVQVNDDTVITTMIFPRYAEAGLDRPLTGKFVIPTDDNGNPLEDAAQKFVEFGASGEFKVAGLALDLPGGLSASAVEGLVKVGPAHNTAAESYDLRLVTVDSDGKHLNEAVCVMAPVTAGLGANAGVFAHGTSDQGLFDIEMPMHPSKGSLSVNFRIHQLAGLEPAAISGEMWFLHSLASAAELRVGTRHGPLAAGGMTLDKLDASMFEDRLLYLIDDLALLQREVCGPLRVPDFEADVDAETIKEIRVSAALLRGATVRTSYTEQRFTLPADYASTVREQTLNVPVLFEINGSRQHDIDGHTIVIEPIAMRLIAATLSIDDSIENGFLAVPAQQDTMLLRMLTSDEIALAASSPTPGDSASGENADTA